MDMRSITIRSIIKQFRKTGDKVKWGGGGGGPMAKNGEKWRKMAKNGDGEFAFFICQIRHFSPIFDFGISLLTDF